MSNEQTIDLREYFGVLRRRPLVFLVSFAVLFGLSIALAFWWPSTYRSTATILIEEQDIPADLVRSAVTSSAVQRITTISQQVMTRGNLMRVIEKYDMYANARAEHKTDKIVAAMRDKISVQTVDVDVIDPSSGRPGRVAIAFTVSFEYSDPQTTQQVAEELAALFLEQNERARSERASGTLTFLTSEAESLGRLVGELEGKLAAFKEQNVTSLPELTELNMRLMDHSERQLSSVETQIRSLVERRFVLEGELAQISPWSPMVSSDGERVVDPLSMLRTLRAQYIAASAKYSPQHPDVVRLKREVAALEANVAPLDARIAHSKELAQLRGELVKAENKYASDHPDVVKLRRAIAFLEAAPAGKPSSGDSTTFGAGFEADNPAYVTLRARLKAVDSELLGMREFRDQLRGKLDDYEARISTSPKVERDYLALSREYESAVRRYREITDSQTDARVRNNLEAQHAEQFSLIDPPQIAEEPIKPNRPLIVLLGLLLSLTGSVGSTALVDAVSRREPRAGLPNQDDMETTLMDLRHEVGRLRAELAERDDPDGVVVTARRSGAI